MLISLAFGRLRLDIRHGADRLWALWKLDGQILAFARWGSA